MIGVAATAPPLVLAIGTAVEARLIGDLADFQLFDGPSQAQAYAEKSVTIGGRWDPNISDPGTGQSGAFTADQTVLVQRQELGGGRRVRETTTVTCIAYAGSGELAMAPHRAIVADVLAMVAGVVRSIRDVDDVPVLIRLADQQWAQVIDTQGGGVMCQFDIVAEALP